MKSLLRAHSTNSTSLPSQEKWRALARITSWVSGSRPLEDIQSSKLVSHSSTFVQRAPLIRDRLLPQRSGILGDCFNSCVRNMDGRNAIARTMARPSLHVHFVHNCEHMYPRMEQSYWTQVLCIL